MKWFANMKIATKLASGFGLCLLLTALIGGVSLVRMNQMNASSRLIVDDTVSGLKSMVAITADIKQYRIYEFRHILATDNVVKTSLETYMATAQTNIAKNYKEYDASINSEEDRQNFKDLKASWETYLTGHPELITLSHTNNFKKCSAYMSGSYFDKFVLVSTNIKKITDWNVKNGDRLAAESAALASSARMTILVLLVSAILAGIVIATLITRTITGPVAQMSGRIKSLGGICVTNLGKAVEALATGDLTAKIATATTLLEIKSSDEFGQMGADLNVMILQTQATIATFEKAQASLSELVGGARAAAESIASTSMQVAAGNDDLSQRTEEQASSLEETASSMEEITATVKQNADNARQANQMAAQAREVAERGGAVVSNAVSSMENINNASKRIADIISVIDEIAFQTNLLALNAAVEAARVGEQGRGFAVVAAEVRNLAGRSATAAKEIKALVQDSVQKVQEGSAHVNQSGQQLDEIVTSVKKVADIIAEITAASQEQSVGIEQVNKAITQMDEVTQQNAALVEEATAASQSLKQQAQDLRGMVAQFRLDASYDTAKPVSSLPVNKPRQMAATGTDGRAFSHRAASVSKLHLVDNEDGFEEF